MAGRARTFTAALLLVLPVSVGVGTTPAHAAAVELVNPAGGCWSYVPDRSVDDVLVSPVVSDRSTALEAWGSGVAPTTLTLEARDGTTDRTAGARLTVENGPVIDPALDTVGTATATVTVQPAAGLPAGVEPSIERLEAKFDAQAGMPVTDLVLTGDFAGDFGDTHVIELQSIFFDAPGTPGAPDPDGSVLVCNGQELGEPTVGPLPDLTPGVNPATTPVSIGLKDTFIGHDVRTLAIQDVKGQAVTSAFRAGDTVELRGSGIDAGDAFTAEICDVNKTCASTPGALVADSQGNAAATITIGDDLAAGEALITVKSDSVTLPRPSAVVLGAPSVAAVEKEGKGRLRVALSGVGWDPAATVVVEGRTPDAASSDAQVEVTVGADGTFKTRFVATDVDTTELRLSQEREGGLAALGQTHTLEYLVPIVPPEKEPGENPPGNPGEPSNPGGTSTTVPPVSGTAVAPPVEIPLPGDRPVDEVNGPAGGVAPSAETPLKISEANLAGEASVGEMFGGSSRREVRFLAENVSSSVVTNPLVRLGVGREAGVEPVIVAAEVGDLQPGARVAVAVDVALPMASFGVYQVVGQVGDSEESRFGLEWQTYPWGLIALNLMGVALLAWGLWRRQQRRMNPAPLVAGAEDDEAGASVIDLTALDNWWGNGKIGRPVDDNDSVVDMEAADKWWAKRDSKVS
ncbi:hypothetical protein [Nocardioides jishulii]|uniref:Uncharacterized protein n=1 Tax=Nocardioides jishulii TaxID=2575440 RepID=A0A4U2YME1_9ACTN|nr:hypothetical protein [Nocardioides jishulii]QCX27612.1 hypothetical protein FCL41_08825 [Nocardioides jishulii]TKI62419.1 hypothetical protein FC770_08490 [Nocardioides jishulii]